MLRARFIHIVTKQPYKKSTINFCTNQYRLEFTVVTNNLKFSMSILSWKRASELFSSYFRTQDDRPSLSGTL